MNGWSIRIEPVRRPARSPGRPRSLPSLEGLRKFVVVAEELSFTRASRQLHVVQSGVSSAIQSLERELGASLATGTGTAWR